MREGRRQLAASPVLIGAVTVLVAIVAVFISYNANQGLPFVPDLRPQGRAAQRRQARAGQRRARRRLPRRRRSRRSRSVAAHAWTARERSLALLDAQARQDDRAAVGRHALRRAPALGARPQVRRGDARAAPTARSRTAPRCRCATPSPAAPELEDVLSTFQPATRADAQKALVGFGDALAGRGADINETIRELRPLLRAPDPVMRNLSDPRHRAAQPVPGARARRSRRWRRSPRCRRACSASWPTPSRALNRDPAALQETIEETPADAGGGDRLVPRPDAVPGATSPTSRGGCGRRAAELRALAAARSTARWPPACPPSGARPSCPSDLEQLLRALEQPVREPEHAARRCRTCAARSS